MSDLETAAAGKRRRSFWIIGGSVVAAILLVPLLVLGWLGFVPGLSSLLGANQPKDLGVQYEPDDMQSYQAKLPITFAERSAAPDNPARPGKKQLFANPRPVAATFTQEELSAALNSADLPWLPLKDIQIRLSDHTAELSASLNTSRIPEFLQMAAGLGYSEADLARVAGYAEKLADDVPIYIKADGAVENSRLDLELKAIVIGRLSVSPDVVGKIAPGGIHKTIRSSESFAIEKAMPENGTLAFTGVLPTTIFMKKN